MALNRKLRVRGAAGVSRVHSGARPVHHGGLSVRVVRTHEPGAHFAVTVPVAVTPLAVRRNRLRRRITERLRLLLAEHKTTDGVRVVISARTPTQNTAEISETLVVLLKKSGILQ